MIKNYFIYSVLIFFALNGFGERVKDLTSIKGVRSNHVIGYGLVVGLDGTGEQTAYTAQTFKTMLSRFGISLPAGLKPKLKNVAAVAVHGELPDRHPASTTPSWSGDWPAP